MNKLLLPVLLLLAAAKAQAQHRYIVFYEDKGSEAAVWYARPQQLLSDKALALRARAGIGISYEDLPVSAAYVEQLNVAGIRVLQSSKWLNASLVETDKRPADVRTACTAIAGVMYAGERPVQGITPAPVPVPADSVPPVAALKTTSVLDYGANAGPIGLLGLDALHDRGFTGRGITVAFLDAGYSYANTSVFFDSLRLSGRLVATWDFWGQDTTVFEKDTHGASCSSKVVGNYPGKYIGTAPGVNAAFAITDDVTETPQDEFYYAAGLEWADSLGAEIVSASIGYKVFDPPFPAYTYADMNGHTAISTIAAAMAASKGLLVVNSAGNSGTLCAPCDADSIICVGGALFSFAYDGRSSYGPSFDGRIKPNVAGFSTNPPRISLTSANVEMNTGYSGTSAATPFIAGLAACLKQAHPDATVWQLIKAIEQSAHKAAAPDSLVGHGVPNARKADSILSRMLAVPRAAAPSAFRLFPNPANGQVMLEGNIALSEVQLLSVTGGLLQQQSLGGGTAAILDVTDLPPAVYFVRITDKTGMVTTLRLLKESR